MDFQEIIKQMHVGYAGDTEYPESGSDEMATMVRHANSAITEHERCVREGVQWPELKNDASVACGGTGTDLHGLEFLDFFREPDGRASVSVGGSLYLVVSAQEGVRADRMGITPYYAWIEGKNLRTLPAASGTAEFKYLKKETRFSTGEETTEPEMSDPTMIVQYGIGMMRIDDEDFSQGEVNLSNAQEALRMMKIPNLPPSMPDDNPAGWGFGM